MQRSDLIQISRKYMLTYFKDSKMQDGWEDYRPEQPRFIDDYYLLFMHDHFRPYSSKLGIENDNLIQIDVLIKVAQLTLTIEDRILSESFLWDADTTGDNDIYMYTHYLLKDLLLEYREVVDREIFEGSLSG